MSPFRKSSNLAARMGRWSAGHRKTAIFGWLAFVVLALVLGMQVGTRQIDNADNNTGQAHRADHILKGAGFDSAKRFEEYILVQSKTHTASDPAFRAAVRDAIAATAATPAADHVRSPYAPSNAAQITKDGHAAYVAFYLEGDQTAAYKDVDKVLAAVGTAQKANPGFSIRESGEASAGKAIDAMFNRQLAQAGELSLPLTLIILLVVFGAAVAAGIPLLLAISAVLATLGLLALPSHLIPMDQSVSAVVLLVGLAVGVDYSLFYLKREREERAAGRGPEASLEVAAATSGRAVLISGFTVIIAMAGMFLSGDKTFMSFAVGTMIVVAVAMLGSLTVLPALLSALGDRVEKGRIPLLGRLRRGSEPQAWKAVLRPVLAHPVWAAAASAGVLIALAIPAFSLHTSITGLDALPKSVSEVRVLDDFQRLYPGSPEPAIVAVKAKSVDAPAVRRGIEQLLAKANASPQMHDAQVQEISADRTVAEIAVALAGKGTDSTSTAALHTLRDEIIPSTIGAVPDTQVAVTGQTAATADFNSLMKSRAPLVFGFVLLFAFLLLLASFRSIVIATKAILLNLLSVGAAYGILVMVFQWGWGENLLNFQSNGGITSWLPIFLFVILFGLSMDYHVFILSRIREAYDRGLSTEKAVEHGITTTAGVVTSAAVVMVGAFLVFVTLPIVDMKEMGVGLAAAVLIDATLVRAVLLPATMKLLGDWNWYLPNWLGWLPRHEHDRSSDPAPAAA
ncbi:MAG TPA: MMPL family transporter [Gaiellaceae bacterium]|nr:MMPL family transporter [Gaiellaceae bacterium]